MSEPTKQATAAWRAWVIRVLVAVVLGLFGLDAVAYQYGGQDATMTQILRDNSADWALIPVVAGIIAGHIWWGGAANKKTEDR